MTYPRKGKADYYSPGDYNAACFQCGRKFKFSELRKHWQGYYVCPAHWEARHPQDFVRAIPDKMGVSPVQPSACCPGNPVFFCTPCSESAYVGIAAVGCSKVGKAPTQAQLDAFSCDLTLPPVPVVPTTCYTENFISGSLSDWTLQVGATKANFSIQSTPYGSAMYGGPISANSCTVIRNNGITVVAKTIRAYVFVSYTGTDDDSMELTFRDPTDTISVFTIIPVRDSVIDSSQRFLYAGQGITTVLIGPKLSLATWYRVDVTLADGTNACTLTVTNMSTGLVHLSTTFTQVLADRSVRYTRFHIESASGVHLGVPTYWAVPQVCDH